MPVESGLNHRGVGDRFLVTKTDLEGNLTYSNDFFQKISGYSDEELIGSPHNMVRHQDMPKSIFKFFWQLLQADQEFWGYVKNSSKTGEHYWVLAHVIPSYGASGQKVGYHSNRRLAGNEAIDAMESLYARIRNAESGGGIAAGEAYLQNVLNEKGGSYNEYVFSI